MLSQSHPTDSIYREDMVFKDPHVAFRGLKNYKLVIWSLRFHGKLFFKQPYVEVLRIWQPEEHLIKWVVGRTGASLFLLCAKQIVQGVGGSGSGQHGMKGAGGSDWCK